MFSIPDRREFCPAFAIWAWVILLVLTFGSASRAAPFQGPAEAETPSQSQKSDPGDPTGAAEGQVPDSQEAEGDAEGEQPVDEDPQPPSKSGYDIPSGGGPTSVESDLMADDLEKRPVVKVLRHFAEPLYRFKNRVDGLWGIAFGMDYNFLNQYASFSFTEDQATSGSFRLYGTWDLFHSKEKFDGRLVYRIENRHTIGGGITPRDLGFDASLFWETLTMRT